MTDLGEQLGEQLVRMMPAAAYTSDDVLAWERRHLYAGTWTCLGRVTDLFPEDATQQRAQYHPGARDPGAPSPST